MRLKACWCLKNKPCVGLIFKTTQHDSSYVPFDMDTNLSYKNPNFHITFIKLLDEIWKVIARGVDIEKLYNHANILISRDCEQKKSKLAFQTTLGCCSYTGHTGGGSSQPTFCPPLLPPKLEVANQGIWDKVPKSLEWLVGWLQGGVYEWEVFSLL